jgi:NhaP-type Na+/H+ or K+/H+ antiporter
MQFAGWLIAIGALLIAIHVTSPLVARLPISPAIVYFVVGIMLGPWGFDWLHPDPEEHALLLERMCELAVLISLFATGSAVGTTLRAAHWRVPVRLASIAMVVTIALAAWLGHGVLGLSAGAAILLAAALAPTDPVLAGEVQVADARDRDALRFGLTGEAGLNDGAAFPFVLLGLGLLVVKDVGAGGWLQWTLLALWGVFGATALGALLGVTAGRFVIRRVREHVDSEGTDAFLGLGLVAVAYGAALALHTYGFLAVFAAAVALQWTVAGEGRREPVAADGEQPVIAPLQRFNADLENLFEFGVVIVMGALFTIVAIPLEAVAVAVVLFLVIRPISVWIALWGEPLAREQRALASWFGIRGVGSLYYAFYALAAGWRGPDADRVFGIVLGVVAVSIFVHGISVTPLMNAYDRQVRAWARRRKRPTVKRV